MERQPIVFALIRNRYHIATAIVILLLAVLFAVLITFVPSLFSLRLNRLFVFLFTLGALLAFALLRTRLASLLEKTLHPERLAYRRFAEQYGQMVMQTTDLTEHFQYVAQTLYQALDAESVSIWLYQAEDSILYLSHVEGRPMESDLTELPADVTIEHLQGTQDVTALPESALRRGWMRLNLQIISSMRWREQLIGVIGLGGRRLGVEHSHDEVRLLGWIAGQMTLVVTNSRLTAELEETISRLQLAYRQTINVQEEERRSLAAELHDDILGRLTTMGLALRNCRKQLDADPRQVESWLESVETETRSVNNRLREITQGLHPSVLTDLGLISAAQAYLDAIARRPLPPSAPGVITLTAQGFDVHRIPNPKMERDLYHVTRQALDNAVTHAHAQQVFIHFRWSNDAISVAVQDTGCGMPDAPEVLLGQRGRLGLLSMNERVRAWGGRLTFDTGPGRGTTVHAHFPTDQPSSAPTHLQVSTHHLSRSGPVEG